jgi:type III secretion protein J
MTVRTSMSRLPLLVLLVATAGCTIPLQHDLSEQDANDIYVLLNENGIAATKTRNESGQEPTYVISVAKGDATQGARLLREHALPRPKKDGLGVFQRIKGMVPTQSEERGIMLEALGGEVSNVFNEIDGVLMAQAIVSLPQVTDLTQPDDKPKPAASVFIKYRPGIDGKPPLSVEQVQRFAARTIQDLDPAMVEVLMTPGLPPMADMEPGARMQQVLGLQMTAASAATFKLYAAGALLLILALAGVSGWMLTRTSGGGGRRRAA